MQMDDVYSVNFVSLILENSHSEKPPVLHHPTRRPRYRLAFSKCHLDMGARSRHEKQPKESGERAKAAEAGGVPFESFSPRGHWPRAAQRQLQTSSAEYKLCGEKGGYGANGMASSPPPRVTQLEKARHSSACVEVGAGCLTQAVSLPRCYSDALEQCSHPLQAKKVLAILLVVIFPPRRRLEPVSVLNGQSMQVVRHKPTSFGTSFQICS